MYALKVKMGSNARVEDEMSEEAKLLADALLREQEGGNGPDDGDDEAAVLLEGDALDFSAGNPRVEHLTGVIHLYRMVELTPKADTNARPEPPKLPEGRNEKLCVLAIPADMGIADLCQFVGGYLPAVRHMRVVRRDRRRRSIYSVLLRFDTLASADAFYKDYNGRPFSVLEPEVICRLVWVRDVEYLSAPNDPPLAPAATAAAATPSAGAGSAAPSGLAAAPEACGAGALREQGGDVSATAAAASEAVGSGGRAEQAALVAPSGGNSGGFGSGDGGGGQLIELPSCPVCLERLDEHVSGVVTTVCNHQFHSECLGGWGDTSCPVCRYCQHPGVTSHCSVCGTSQDAWICLICGHVGCGRYKQGHSIDHWRESGHCYALELESQRVWDYVGDGYVHRLIQSKTDGKLVAVPSPGPGAVAGYSSDDCGGHGGGGGAGGGTHGRAHHGAQCGSGYGYGDSCSQAGGSEFEEALLASKLDAIAQEHEHLLVTQLESQRQYYEAQGARALAEARDRAAAAEAERDQAAAAAAAAREEARQEQQRRKALERKLAELQAGGAKAGEEKKFLRQLNAQLMDNQRDLKEALEEAKGQAQAKDREKDEKIRDLEEQVRDLMLFLEAQHVIQGEGGELKDGSIVGVGDPPPAKPQRRRQQGKKR